MDVYSIIAYYAMADGSKARSLVKKIMSSAEKDLFTRLRLICVPPVSFPGASDEPLHSLTFAPRSHLRR